MRKRIPLLSNVIYSLDHYHKRSSPAQIAEALQRNGWRNIGCGCDKTVFGHDAYPTVVIKVFCEGGWKLDPVFSRHGIPEVLKPHWLEYIFACKRFVVQPRVNKRPVTRRVAQDLENTLGCGYDLHKDNLGYHQGRLVIVDCCSPDY